MGYPIPLMSGLDGGTPFPDVRTGWGYCQEIGRQTSYAAGGMPLAFTQEDFLVHCLFALSPFFFFFFFLRGGSFLLRLKFILHTT